MKASNTKRNGDMHSLHQHPIYRPFRRCVQSARALSRLQSSLHVRKEEIIAISVLPSLSMGGPVSSPSNFGAFDHNTGHLGEHILDAVKDAWRLTAAKNPQLLVRPGLCYAHDSRLGEYGFGMFLLVAARLSSAEIAGNSVSFEVTDVQLVSAICPSPVWNESRQALEYPPLQGVLFGRLLPGASGNASHTV